MHQVMKNLITKKEPLGVEFNTSTNPLITRLYILKPASGI